MSPFSFAMQVMTGPTLKVKPIRSVIPPAPSKVCACCKIEKPIAEFETLGINNQGKKNIGSYCRICKAKKNREARQRKCSQ